MTASAKTETKLDHYPFFKEIRVPVNLKPMNQWLRFAGIGIALWVGLFAAFMIGLRLISWWTGKPPGHYWP
jgi:hypothetical protein